MQAPRLPCPVCGRSIAVLMSIAASGRFARHDPPERGPLLLSCDGSLRPVPLGLGPLPGPPTLFDPGVLDDPPIPEDRAPEAEQDALF